MMNINKSIKDNYLAMVSKPLIYLIKDKCIFIKSHTGCEMCKDAWRQTLTLYRTDNINVYLLILCGATTKFE